MSSPPTTTNGRISPKEATQRAAAFLTEIMGAQRSVRLEELVLSHDERTWDVTLSFLDELSLAPLGYPRVYKRFEVDAISGQVRAMRIREV